MMRVSDLVGLSGGVRYRKPSTRMRLRDRAMLAGYLELMGVSERGFATSAGLSHSTVNHLVSGRRSTCSQATADAIERTLGCPAGLLFRRDSRT